jgi:hypothetical protein
MLLDVPRKISRHSSKSSSGIIAGELADVRWAAFGDLVSGFFFAGEREREMVIAGEGFKVQDSELEWKWGEIEKEKKGEKERRKSGFFLSSECWLAVARGGGGGSGWWFLLLVCGDVTVLGEEELSRQFKGVPCFDPDGAVSDGDKRPQESKPKLSSTCAGIKTRYLSWTLVERRLERRGKGQAEGGKLVKGID